MSKKHVLGTDQDYDGNKQYNSNLNIDGISFVFPDIDWVAGQVYPIEPYSWDNQLIEKFAIRCNTGTATCTIKINGVGVTGLIGVAVSSVYAVYDATALNVVVVGDEVTLTVDSLNDTPTQFVGSIKTKRV